MQNLGKNRIGIVYKQIRTKNALSQNCPASLVLRFACKASACQFLLTHFFTEFASSQFSAIFHEIRYLHIDSCFVWKSGIEGAELW